MRKYSRQRQLILDYLKSATSHPTAEQIYAGLKPQNPALSLATVYRNLRLLADDGIILRLDTGESTDRFDADLSEHHHFICTKCGQVTDVCRSFLTKKELEDALESGFRADRHSLYIYGFCAACNVAESVSYQNNK